MSKRHILLAVVGLMMWSTASAWSQGVTPLIGENYFSNDHQYFAPAVWEDLGRNRKANTGWFATISRMRTYMDRQEESTRLVGPDGGDWTWGYSVDVGYMTEDDHGWLFAGFDIQPSGDGISLFRQPQLNRVNETINEGLEDADSPPSFADLLPVIGQNNQFTNQRDFDQIKSFNTTKVTSIEGMKTWRMPAFHNRGVFEPMMGLRYMKIRDLTSDDQYLRYTEDEFFGGRNTIQQEPPIVINNPDGSVTVYPQGVNVLPGQIVSQTPALLLDEDQLIEQLVFDDAYFLNHLVLAQIGFRVQVPAGRWMLNHELKAFCGNNWQEFERIIDIWSLRYDGNTDDDMVINDEVRRVRPGSANLTEFVFGSEARATAAYHVTRDLKMNLGVQHTYVAQGIGRGNRFVVNDQAFGHLSVIFGVQYNR